mmetsp:Transcript_25239/g.71983  ORF Transcript_25239/g.71983 Transcript_25239/m.71983 type:complete len:448 (-) Transcript_25239:89-1432(-)
MERPATAGATPRLRRSFRPEPIDLQGIEDGAGLAALTSRPTTGGRPTTADAGRDELLAMLAEERARKAKAEDSVSVLRADLQGVKVEHATIHRALRERTDQTKKVERDVRMQTVVFRQKQEEHNKKNAELKTELVEAKKALAVMTLPPRPVAKQEIVAGQAAPTVGQAPKQAVDVLRASLLDLLSTGGATTWTPRPAQIAVAAAPMVAAQAAPLAASQPLAAPPLGKGQPEPASAPAVAAEAPSPLAEQLGEDAPPQAQPRGAAPKRAAAVSALDAADAQQGNSPSQTRERSRGAGFARPRTGSTVASARRFDSLKVKAAGPVAAPAVVAAVAAPAPPAVVRLELPALGRGRSNADSWGFDPVLDLVSKGKAPPSVATGRSKNKMTVLDGVYGGGRTSSRRQVGAMPRVASLPSIGPKAGAGLPASQLDSQASLGAHMSPKRLALVC